MADCLLFSLLRRRHRYRLFCLGHFPPHCAVSCSERFAFWDKRCDTLDFSLAPLRRGVQQIKSLFQCKKDSAWVGKHSWTVDRYLVSSLQGIGNLRRAAEFFVFMKLLRYHVFYSAGMGYSIGEVSALSKQRAVKCQSWCRRRVRNRETPIVDGRPDLLANLWIPECLGTTVRRMSASCKG